MNIRAKIAAISAVSLLAACAQAPLAPTVQVMPAPNKPFAAFQDDDVICRNFAAQSSAGVAESGNNQQVGTAVIGTLLGAGLGAAIGAAAGSAGTGAAIGAASGAFLGTAAGAGGAGYAQLSLQQQFDVMYGQCMYAHGNQVPGFSSPPGTPPYSGAPGYQPYGPPSYGAPPYSGTPVPPPR